MSNAHVVKLQTELTGILERAFDRTTRAINDSRSGTYTGTQLYQDTAEALVDGVYGALLPFLEFLPFTFDRWRVMPTATFDLTAAVDDVGAIPLVPPDTATSVTKVDWEDLAITGTTDTIPKKHLDVRIAGNDLLVKVMGASVPSSTKPGVYVGNILADNVAGKPAIAKIRVRWFVI